MWDLLGVPLRLVFSLCNLLRSACVQRCCLPRRVAGVCAHLSFFVESIYTVCLAENIAHQTPCICKNMTFFYMLRFCLSSAYASPSALAFHLKHH